MANEFNPIKTVDGQAIPCPSTYKYLLQDVSIADSGRTEDALMHKNRCSQKVKIELAWQGVSTHVASQILNAFNPEYISVNCLCLLEGDYATKTFYVGDRSVPSYNVLLDIWENISFNIIER